MEKISPLRASLKAFEQFRTQRAQKTNETPTPHTNPFGMTFKGGIISGDVFEKVSKNEEPTETSAKDAFTQAGKLAASAWVATKNSFNSMKQNIISFGNKLKENAVNTWDKLSKTEISFTGLFENSPAALQKKPVGELETMLRSELETV